MSGRVTTVRIKYDGCDKDLDNVLEASLVLLGFKLTDLGFDVEAEERDLVFRRGLEKQPVCPYCNEVMVKGRIEMADGTWQEVWLCACVDEAENTEVPNANSNLGG